MSKPTKYQRWWMGKLNQDMTLVDAVRGNDMVFLDNPNSGEYVAYRSWNLAKSRGWVKRCYSPNIDWYLILTPAGKSALEE